MNKLQAVREAATRKVEHLVKEAKKINRLSKQCDEHYSGLKGRPFSASELARLMGMDYERFSHLLPYRYFDKSDQLFINESSLGFACELAPLSGANEEIINNLAELLKNKISSDVCVEIMMVGNSLVGPILDENFRRQHETDPIFHSLDKSQYLYMKSSSINGFPNKRGLDVGLKNYRLFMFLSKKSGYDQSRADYLCDLRQEILTELKNSSMPGIPLGVEGFLDLLKVIINADHTNISPPHSRIDQYKEMHEQIVDPNLNVRVYPTYLETKVAEEGKKQHVVSLSLKSLPEETALWRQADNFANIFKVNNSIPCPFVIRVGFKVLPQEKSKMRALRKTTDLERKANSPYAKWIPGTTQAYMDWKRIRDDLSSDEVKLCEMHYNVSIWTTPDKRKEHTSKVINAFRVNGMDLYPIQYQQLQTFLSLMPFMLEGGMWDDLRVLGRTNTLTSFNLVNMLPLVADYKGSSGGAGVIAPTFRQQITAIDIFDPSLDNYNSCITATSGSGKSVLSQSIISSVLADGGKVWVIDLGQSYKKFCETLGGSYLDASNLQLNPFSGVTNIADSAESIRDLLAVMASPNEGLGDVQKAYLLDAVHYAFDKKSADANMDDVIDYLMHIEQSNSKDSRIKDIAILLKKYSLTQNAKDSLSARIFNRSSQLDSKEPSQERFTVLELGELENQPDLLKAVLFALILNIEKNMYHSDQTRKKLCVIDEAWRLLSGSNKTAASFIEKGFRTARKHRGSFMTITQSIKDFYQSAEAQAAWSCAENKIIMRQNEKAFKDFLTEQPDYFSAFEERMIQNFRSSSENGFSEFLVQQGSVSSFHRLFLDPFSRVMYSSRAEEHQAVKTLVEEGYSIAQAIYQVALSLYGEEMDLIEGQGV